MSPPQPHLPPSQEAPTPTPAPASKPAANTRKRARTSKDNKDKETKEPPAKKERKKTVRAATLPSLPTTSSTVLAPPTRAPTPENNAQQVKAEPEASASLQHHLGQQLHLYQRASEPIPQNAPNMPQVTQNMPQNVAQQGQAPSHFQPGPSQHGQTQHGQNQYGQHTGQPYQHGRPHNQPPPLHAQHVPSMPFQPPLRPASQVSIQLERLILPTGAHWEILCYQAELQREQALIARENLKAQLGLPATIPATPALDKGFVPGPACAALGVFPASSPPPSREDAEAQQGSTSQSPFTETAPPSVGPHTAAFSFPSAVPQMHQPPLGYFEKQIVRGPTGPVQVYRDVPPGRGPPYVLPPQAVQQPGPYGFSTVANSVAGWNLPGQSARARQPRRDAGWWFDTHSNGEQARQAPPPGINPMGAAQSLQIPNEDDQPSPFSFHPPTMPPTQSFGQPVAESQAPSQPLPVPPQSLQPTQVPQLHVNTQIPQQAYTLQQYRHALAQQHQQQGAAQQSALPPSQRQQALPQHQQPLQQTLPQASDELQEFLQNQAEQAQQPQPQHSQQHQHSQQPQQPQPHTPLPPQQPTHQVSAASSPLTDTDSERLFSISEVGA